MLRISKINKKVLSKKNAKANKEVAKNLSNQESFLSAVEYLFESEFSQIDVSVSKASLVNYMGSGIWQGNLSKQMSLHGKLVYNTDFDDLSNSIHPVTKEQFAKKTGSSTNDVLQLLFSAPKDFSMIAFLDEESGYGIYREMFDDAVNETMKYIESKITARVNNKNEKTPAQNILYASFTHETSRPTTDKSNNKLSIRPDMQLHAHVLLSKYCADENGKIRTMVNQEIFKNQVFYGTYFRSLLAQKLIEHGYEIIEHTEIDTQKDFKGREKKVKVQSFKIKQITNEHRRMFSKRKADIEYLASRYGVDSTLSKDLIATNFRRSKEKFDRKELIQIWKDDAKSAGMNSDFFKNLKTFNRACISERLLTPEQIVRNSMRNWKGNNVLFDTVLMQNICEYAQYVPINPFEFKQKLMDEGYISRAGSFTYKVNFTIDKSNAVELKFHKDRVTNKQAFLAKYLVSHNSNLIKTEYQRKQNSDYDAGGMQHIRVKDEPIASSINSISQSGSYPNTKQVATHSEALCTLGATIESLYASIEELQKQARKKGIDKAEIVKILAQIERIRLQIEELEKQKKNQYKH